ncbi:TlyA family RNA methyltransferase [Alkalicoccus urumqiensis]|uniref:TlyA family rRNA (Cytidine-2'-O)-methyltransferase n=1 Tax=Alkalicoccus urumqiensis TaxID=1548213 RepID=A0A2P6MKB2_ALKUR|nr:TlyA family RNA methyltransferase [Alkalicoccus urumqiensis]PRO66716.1 TlyA family rRNA (cytidine-2'-O)-methyltransferase [Alkalicoccus urumqiensis]
MKKERIDLLLVEQGLVESREKAKRSIMAGLVLADGQRVDKAGMKVPVDAELRLKGQESPYVGRGGLKLERALQLFPLQVKDKIVLDVGASTGGFTDCALQHGASLVYAVDVGYNQLAWKLRRHEQVVVMERTNFRYAGLEDFTEGRPHTAVMDVSFISIRLMLPVIKSILPAEGEVMALIKPQFEAGREDVGRKGIVRDPAVHERVIKEMIAFAESLGYAPKGIAPSPIRGGGGNREFLLYLTCSGEGSITAGDIAEALHEQERSSLEGTDE